VKRSVPNWRLLAALGAAVLLCPAGANARRDVYWQPVHEQEAKGVVSATLDYERKVDEGYTEFRNMRLRVVRGGKPVVEKLVCSGIGCWPALYKGDARWALVLRNVGGSKEPEVLVEIYTGGAHCCRHTVIASRGTQGYRTIRHSWGDPGYRGQWRNGIYYFLTVDPSFAYAFTSYAESSAPALAWTMTRSGRLRNVTRQRLDYVRANATVRWRLYRERRDDSQSSVRGILAAWCADQHLLDRGDDCEVELERAAKAGWLESQTDGDESPAEYIVKLRRFLRDRGYDR
jgi:hypothetical protein